mgnify:CR=1 FL=1
MKQSNKRTIIFVICSLLLLIGGLTLAIRLGSVHITFKDIWNSIFNYNETLDYIDKLEKEGKALVLRPTEEVIIDSMEKDLDKIQRIYDYGYALALEHLEEIKAICHE